MLPTARLRAGAARIRHKDYGWRIQGRATIPRPRTAAAARLLAPTPRELAIDCLAVPAGLCHLPPTEDASQAAADLTAALAAGDMRYPIAARFPLERISDAHDAAFSSRMRLLPT
jgi:hypothetical protein